MIQKEIKLNSNPFLRWLQRNLPAIVLFLVVLVGLTVMIHSVTTGNTLGADFYIYWNSGRAAIFDHQSPYDPDVTLQTQLAILGRPAPPNEDQLAYAYPYYAIFILLPLILLPFDWAQAAWMALTFLALITVSFSLTTPKNRWVAFSIPIFYPFAFSIILGNYNILIGIIFLIIFGAIYIKKSISTNDYFLGFLLAITSIKPQLTWLFILFLLLHFYHLKKWRVIITFFITPILLSFISFLLEPEWLSDWLRLINAYTQYNDVQIMLINFINEFLPIQTSTIIALIILGVAIILGGILLFSSHKNPVLSIQLIAYFGFYSYLFHPFGQSYEQIILLIPFIVWSLYKYQQFKSLVITAWIINIVLSWISFYLTRFTNNYPLAIYELPILFHSIWLIWIFTFKQGRFYEPN